MVSKTVTIINETGIHARPAGEFVAEAKNFKSAVSLEYNDQKINAKSIIKLLSLGLKKGAEVTIIAEGEDEEVAAAHLSNYLATLEEK